MLNGYYMNLTLVKYTLDDGITAKFGWYLVGKNQETKKYIYYWRLYLISGSNTYITSNKEQQFTISDFRMRVGTTEKETIPTAQTGTFNINMDINDEKTIAEGMFESEYSQMRFDASIKFDDAIFVNVANETGTEYNYTLGIDKYKDTNWVMNLAGLFSTEDVAAKFVSFNNFNDEESPLLKYYGERTTGIRIVSFAVSLDGNTEHITRSLTGHTHAQHELTIDFTDEERKIIREFMRDKTSHTAYFYITSRRNADNTEMYFHRYGIKRTITIINGEPVLTPYIEDTNATTLALTGDKSVIVRFHSNAYVNSNVVWQKEAKSKNILISVGAKSINTSEGMFNGVEGSSFVFSATDSRNLNTTKTVNPPYVDYVKLSCYIDYEPVKADTGILSFYIRGNYYNGSFGATANNLGLMYRLKEENGEWSGWYNATNAITLKEHTYEAKINFNGLDYRKTYQLQANATDRLNVISSVVYTLTTIPVFDWSKTDFNFNVPVGFSDSATFNGTVDLNNAVVEGLNIDTSLVAFDGNTIADYVIETGTEAMGTNGTWYWSKWKSGKAECYGVRNYGNMAVSTSWGNLYRSQTFSQDLPSGLFAATPTINITLQSGNYGGWIARHEETAASTYETGSFIVVRPASATISQAHIGFHIVGTWK